MKLLAEIKEIAQAGMEEAIVCGNDNAKKKFLEILIKAEIYLQKNEVEVFNIKRPTRLSAEDKSKMYLVAYCFSYYEHFSLYPNLSQRQAFFAAADKLGVKESSLRNARDFFDGHNNNSRVGWQQEMPKDLKEARETYNNFSKEDIISLAKDMLEIN